MDVATINGIDVDTARRHAELTNATGYHTARCECYLLVSYSSGWLDRARLVYVTIDLRHGGSTDHLFDRLAARVIERLHGRLFSDASAVRNAADSITRPECNYTIDVIVASTHCEIPTHLAADAEHLRDADRRNSERRNLAAKRAEFAKLDLAAEERDCQFVIVNRKTRALDGQYSYAINLQQDNYFVSLCLPGDSFATANDALAKIDGYRRAIGL
jgi:hypothetical protein